MSRRKYRAPRHGSKAFLGHKKTKLSRGRLHAHRNEPTAEDFPQQSLPPHLDSFLAYKAGCTHVLREIVRPNSPLNKKEVAQCATVLEAAPMVCVGLVLYRDTPAGLRTVFAHTVQELSDAYVRAASPRLVRHAGRPLAFSTRNKNGAFVELNEDVVPAFDVVRLVLHTEPPQALDGRKRAHVLESQVCGGEDGTERLRFALALLGKSVSADSVFAANEAVDVAGITKGKGFQGVVKRSGVKVLSKKARKGKRRVGCIGPWHPSNVSYAVARAGQLGHFHRTEKNKLMLGVGKAAACSAEGNAATSFDPTQKHITPMGGFKHYGPVNAEFLLVKGSVAGPVKSCVAVRKSLAGTGRKLVEEGRVKFIDTASKMGKGRWQTSNEKEQFFGNVKTQ